MCFNIILRVKKTTYKVLKKTLSLIKITTIFKIVFRNIKKRSEKNTFFVTLVAALSCLVLNKSSYTPKGACS